jgi:putative glycosyltransferase
VAVGAPPAPALSVVATLYGSRAFLPTFLDEAIEAATRAAGADWEILLVNDGSPDDSLAYALERRALEPRIVVVDLSRNFGHHAAMWCGLGHARGERVFLIDCDLEVRPAFLAELDARQRATGADLVFGYQEARKGGLFERTSGALFWRMLNAMSEVRMPESMVTERLLTRRFLDALLRLGDANLFLGGMMCWTGFVQIGVPVAKGLREGRSTYTPLRRLQLMVNAISSFSSRPLSWMFNAGVAITALSFCYVMYLVARKLLFDDALVGFTSLMALIALALGITTTGLGLLGIYLAKVFNQVQSRPVYIVRDLHR